MDKPGGFEHWIVTPHARLEFARRAIPEAVVALALRRPEQRFFVRIGREVCQRRATFGERPCPVLVRAFVDVGRWPPEVVTVYFTTKIEKYWRRGQ